MPSKVRSPSPPPEPELHGCSVNRIQQKWRWGHNLEKQQLPRPVFKNACSQKPATLLQESSHHLGDVHAPGGAFFSSDPPGPQRLEQKWLVVQPLPGHSSGPWHEVLRCWRVVPPALGP